MASDTELILQLTEWAYKHVKDVKLKYKKKKVDPFAKKEHISAGFPFMNYKKRHLIEKGLAQEESPYDEARYQYDDPDDDRTLVIEWEKNWDIKTKVRYNFHDFFNPSIGVVIVEVYSPTMRNVKGLAKEALKGEINRLKEKLKK
ncbi:MAG: hypothetical protein QXS52_03685 [Thermoplasmata archaeon]